MSNLEGNFYELMNLDNFSTLAEVKTKYQQIIRKVHPDKLQQSNLAKSEQSFLKIQEAWKVLGNPQKKIEYDLQLQQLITQQDYNISDCIPLEEFEETFINEETTFSYDCRCGGSYFYCHDNIQPVVQGETVIVACSNCSLHVEVIT
uniref:DnaJ homolog subfamily C member 24-like n=1 Tax=Phallusia mammillata TaxID=59560 RepID=A0A6F9DAL7_9ASCI|nr:dnaJ homolog subfamily C member 24-like [Phallusia mammillata]